jgi:hypothetical protein
MLRKYETVMEQVENGDLTWHEARPDLEELVRDLTHARMDLVDLLASPYNAHERDAIVERLTEYRRIEDAITGTWQRTTDRYLVREQHKVVREQTDSQERAATANNTLTEAANAQTAALVQWTKWLAAATIVLAVATVVLVIATLAA